MLPGTRWDDAAATWVRMGPDAGLPHAPIYDIKIRGFLAPRYLDGLRLPIDSVITFAQARNEAAEHLQRSQQEVAALREEAEARMRELQADTEAIQQERNQLLGDIREITTRVEEVASAADARFPPPEAAEQAEGENLQSGTAGEADATEVSDMPTAEGAAPP